MYKDMETLIKEDFLSLGSFVVNEEGIVYQWTRMEIYNNSNTPGNRLFFAEGGEELRGVYKRINAPEGAQKCDWAVLRTGGRL